MEYLVEVMIKLFGMGPGNINHLTMEAINAIKSADRVIAFGRISTTAKILVQDVIEVNRVQGIIENIDNNVNTAILTSGDPCFFGMLVRIEGYCNRSGNTRDFFLPIYDDKLCQKTNEIPLLLSLHGREESLSKVIKSKLSIIFTDKTNNPNLISERLVNWG